MTAQLITAVASRDRTAPAEAWHRHDRACFWYVDECRWQCSSYPLVRYALDRCTAIGRPVTDSGPKTSP